MAVVKFHVPDRGPDRDNNNDDQDREYDEQVEDGSYDGSGGNDRSQSAGEARRRKMTRKQKMSLLLRIAVFTCIMAAVIVFIIQQQSERVYSGSEFREVTTVTIPSAATCLNLGNNILIYSKDGASCMNQSGSTLWSISYEMQQPVVSVCGNIAAIGDYEGSTVHILNATEGEVGTIATNMPLRTLSVASNGEVAAVLEDSATTWIYIFDIQGNTIAYVKRTMEQSGYPIAVTLSPNGTLMCCSQLTVESSSVKTSVAFYNFGAVGQSETDRLVAGYDYEGEVAPYVRFLSNNVAVSVSDTRTTFYSGDEKPASGTNIFYKSDLEGVWSSDSYVALLFADPAGEEAYTLDIYNASGKEVGSIPFTMDYTSVQFFGDRVVIDDGQSMLLYSVNGTLQYSGSMGDAVSLVLPSTSANRLTLVTKSSIKTMILK